MSFLRGSFTPEASESQAIGYSLGEEFSTDPITKRCCLATQYIQYRGAVYRLALRPWSNPPTRVNYDVEAAVKNYMYRQYPDAELVNIKYDLFDEGNIVYLSYQDDDYDYDIEIRLHYVGLKGELSDVDISWYLDGKPTKPPAGFPSF